MLWGQFKDAATRRLRSPELDGDIAGFFNDVQAKVARETQWRHFYKRFITATVAPIPLTATVVNGSAAVTITVGVTPAASWVGQLFKMDTDGAYYEVSAVNAQVVTLTSAYTGAGRVDTGRMIFYQVALPSNFQTPHLAHVSLMSGASQGEPLTATETEETFHWYINEAGPTSRPESFRIDGGMMQLSPAPDAVYNLALFLGRQPVVMDVNADPGTVLDWPSDFHDVLLDGVLEIGFADIDDALVAMYAKRFRTGLLAAVAQNNTPPGITMQIDRWDDYDFDNEGRYPEVV